MKRLCYFLMPAALLLLLCSCEHKTLDYLHISLKVSYDWSKAPDADPASMSFKLFPGSEGKAVDYNIMNNTGAKIIVETGDYTALSYNSDTENVRIKNDGTPEGLVLYTDPVGVLPATGTEVSKLYRVPGTEGEAVVNTPDVMYFAKDKAVFDEFDNPFPELVMKPEQMTSNVTVNITDVININKISIIDAILTGMAGQYVPATGKVVGSACTLPFAPVINASEYSMKSKFASFGDHPQCDANYVVLYMIMSDGTDFKYTCDVTDQVANAANPKDIVINIKGIGIPISGEAGYHPSVDGWIEINPQFINL